MFCSYQSPDVSVKMYISAFYLYSNRDFDGWDGVNRHILTVPATRMIYANGRQLLKLQFEWFRFGKNKGRLKHQITMIFFISF
jgi:hypothetical protein